MPYKYHIAMPKCIVPNADPNRICFEFDSQKTLDDFIREKPILTIRAEKKLQISIDITNNPYKQILKELCAKTGNKKDLALAYVVFILRDKNPQNAVAENKGKLFLKNVNDSMGIRSFFNRQRTLKKIIDDYELLKNPFSDQQHQWETAIDSYIKQQQANKPTKNLFDTVLPVDQLEQWICQNLGLVKNGAHTFETAFNALAEMRHMLQPKRRDEIATATIAALPANKYYLAAEWKESLPATYRNSLSTWLFSTLASGSNISCMNVINTLITLESELVWRDTVNNITSVLENKQAALEKIVSAGQQMVFAPAGTIHKPPLPVKPNSGGAAAVPSSDSTTTATGTNPTASLAPDWKPINPAALTVISSTNTAAATAEPSLPRTPTNLLASSLNAGTVACSYESSVGQSSLLGTYSSHLESAQPIPVGNTRAAAVRTDYSRLGIADSPPSNRLIAASSSPLNDNKIDVKKNLLEPFEYAEKIFNTVLIVVAKHVSFVTRTQFAEYILGQLENPTTWNGVTGMLSPIIITDGERLGKALLQCLKQIQLVTNQAAIFNALSKFKAIIPQNLHSDIATELFKLTGLVTDDEKSAHANDSQISDWASFSMAYASFRDKLSDQQNQRFILHIRGMLIDNLQSEERCTEVLKDLKILGIELPELMDDELLIAIIDSHNRDEILRCLFILRHNIINPFQILIQKFIEQNDDGKPVDPKVLALFNRTFTLLGNEIIPVLSLEYRKRLLAIAKSSDTQTAGNPADEKDHKPQYHEQWSWRIKLCDAVQPAPIMPMLLLKEWIDGVCKIPDDESMEYDSDRHSFFMFVLFIQKNQTLLTELKESPELCEKLIIRSINHFCRWAQFYIDEPSPEQLSRLMSLPRVYNQAFEFIKTLITETMYPNIIKAINAREGNDYGFVAVYCQRWLHAWFIICINQEMRDEIFNTAVKSLSRIPTLDTKLTQNESGNLIKEDEQHMQNLFAITLAGVQKLHKPKLKLLLQILVIHLIPQGTRDESINAHEMLKYFIIPLLSNSERMYLLQDLLVPKFTDPKFSSSEKFISILSLTHYTLARDFMISVKLRVPDVKAIVIEYLEDTYRPPKLGM